jgi:hypothetical protein
LRRFRAPNSEGIPSRACPNEKKTAVIQVFGGKGKQRVASSESLKFLAGLETHRFAGRDAYFLAGARISADASLARAHVEHTEAAQLNSLAFAERALHGSKDGFDSLLRLGPAHAGLVNNGIYDIQLNHTSLLLSNGKLC